MKFFVAKVDVKKVRRDNHGYIVLSPLRFAFDASELRLPVRLGLLNADGKQDLIVYVLHPEKRFEVANYKNVFMTTNVINVQVMPKAATARAIRTNACGAGFICRSTGLRRGCEIAADTGHSTASRGIARKAVEPHRVAASNVPE